MLRCKLCGKFVSYADTANDKVLISGEYEWDRMNPESVEWVVSYIHKSCLLAIKPDEKIEEQKAFTSNGCASNITCYNFRCEKCQEFFHMEKEPTFCPICGERNKSYG